MQNNSKKVPTTQEALGSSKLVNGTYFLSIQIHGLIKDSRFYETTAKPNDERGHPAGLLDLSGYVAQIAAHLAQ